MKVSEIFTSIQGESTYAGLPCTFVRLADCNLRCIYCDTEYARDNHVVMSIDEIVAHVKLIGVNLVEITGGEPLLQGTETLQLIEGLLDEGYQVLVETNGSFTIRDIDRRAVIVLDVKTPGSGMDSGNDFSNFEHLKPFDEVKFVVCSRDDYEWSKNVVARYGLRDRCVVLYSPALGMISPRLLAEWIIRDRLDVRFNIQIHKYIFGSDERGV